MEIFTLITISSKDSFFTDTMAGEGVTDGRVASNGVALAFNATLLDISEAGFASATGSATESGFTGTLSIDGVTLCVE